jgi:hypothetical protein
VSLMPDQSLDQQAASHAEREKPEVWARGPPSAEPPARASMPQETLTALSQLCGKCLYRTLSAYVRVHGQEGKVFVMTGEGGL